MVGTVSGSDFGGLYHSWDCGFADLRQASGKGVRNLIAGKAVFHSDGGGDA